LIVVERGLVDTALEIVRDHEAGHPGKEAEHAHVRADPVGKRLGPGRLGVGVVGGAEHADEDLGLAHDARLRVDDRHLLAGVVDEDLVAGDVVLAHDRRQPPLELAVQVAEARVAVAVGLRLPVLLPQDHQADAGPLHLAGQRRPVRLGAAAAARAHTGAGKQLLLQELVGQLRRQRP
jgi:hypothetical protein